VLTDERQFDLGIGPCGFSGTFPQRLKPEKLWEVCTARLKPMPLPEAVRM